MANEVDELDFLIEHRERTKAFDEAKKNASKDPDEWRRQKDEMREWRQRWREIRAAFAAESAEGDAVASPDTVGLKTKAGKA